MIQLSIDVAQLIAKPRESVVEVGIADLHGALSQKGSHTYDHILEATVDKICVKGRGSDYFFNPKKSLHMTRAIVRILLDLDCYLHILLVITCFLCYCLIVVIIEFYYFIFS